MSQKILVFAGKKQSGKSSAANFVAGYTLSQLGRRGVPFCPVNFSIDEEGHLIVNTSVADAEGNIVYGDGILDLNRFDEEFIIWASNIMWPHVKLYSFADTLKQVAITVFGIPAENVYGTDEDKRKSTNIKWVDMCAFLPPRVVADLKRHEKYDKKMTAREFLQYFGTNICRRLYDDCWVNSCFNRIAADGSDMALISDCRFPNEVKTSKKMGAKIIKFTRVVDEDDVHESEVELDKLGDGQYDLVIDNQFMTIKEKNQAVLDALYNWGWFTSHVELEQ